MNEKQPLMGPSATSQPSTCQTISAWPLDRHQIWQGLTDKSIWIEAVVGVITQIIWTACFSSTSLSLVALYNMAFPFVPMYIATKVILKPLLDRGFGRLFGPCVYLGRAFLVEARDSPPSLCLISDQRTFPSSSQGRHFLHCLRFAPCWKGPASTSRPCLASPPHSQRPGRIFSNLTCHPTRNFSSKEAFLWKLAS